MRQAYAIAAKATQAEVAHAMSQSRTTLDTCAESRMASTTESTMNTLTLATPASTLSSAHEHAGHALGWDHARHALTPPVAYLAESTALRAGWLAGRSAFGDRTLPAGRAVQMWLRLRLHAWRHGHPIEPIQVTPHYLAQLEVGHCPITRAAFTDASVFNGEAVFSRLRSQADYAAGHLAQLSAKADQAIAHAGWRDTMRVAQHLDAGLQTGICGLNAAQWARLAVLRSFVEPTTHAEACEIPLLVLPPNRLRLFNPAQALQAFVSRQLLVEGWSLRVSRIESLVPGQAARHAFQTFFHALLPRVLEAGRNVNPHELRWAIEDAWRQPLVQQRWSRFARQLSAAQCEALVLRAHAKRLGQGRAQEWDDTRASEGWNLEPNDAPARFAVGRRRPVRGADALVRRAPHTLAMPAPIQAALPLH